MATWTPFGDRLVVFVARKAFFNQVRMSAALRRRGYTTVAIVLEQCLRTVKSGFFDDVITTNLHSLLIWLNKTPNLCVHTQSWLFQADIPTLIQAFKHPSSQQIVEFMDLNSFLFPPDAVDRLRPAMVSTWGEGIEDDNRLHQACENYLVRHADGVIFPGSPRHAATMGVTHEERQRRILHFLGYPLREFFAPNLVERDPPAHPEDVRLVFAGGVVPTDDDHHPDLFCDAQMVNTAKKVLSQGLHLDVYNNPLIVRKADYRRRYFRHIELQEEYPAQYRFREGAMAWAIPKLLVPYDYGLILYDYGRVGLGEEHFRNLIPAKLFMYLEAGLPVLVSRRAVATCEFVEEHKIGRGVSEKELDDLPAVLAQLDHAALRRNVLAAREVLQMDRQVERLIAFYEATRPGT